MRGRPIVVRRASAVAAALGVAAAAAAGCGAAVPYAFVPAEPAISIEGSAVTHAVPPERPRGTVGVAVVGADATGLHVRMVVVHDGDGPAWTVDVRAQHVVLAREGTVAPARSGAGDDAPAIVVVAPRSSAVIDLDFPLPGCTDRGRPLRAFDVIWQIDTGRLVHGADRFHRVELELEPAQPQLATGPDW